MSELPLDRWTPLIVRDAFYGVRRFGDFATQLGIPRASLTSRLKLLVSEGILTRGQDAAGNIEYQLTAKGVELWPAIRALMAWGDAHYSPTGIKRTLRHDQDGPGFTPTGADPDLVSQAMNKPKRLLAPIVVAAGKN